MLASRLSDPTVWIASYALQPAFNIGRIPKFDHISSYMRDILHWLPLRQRIAYRVAALVWRCLLGLAPVYLIEHCSPTLSARAPSVRLNMVFSLCLLLA